MSLREQDCHYILCRTVYTEFQSLLPKGISLDIVPFENHSRPDRMNRLLQDLIRKVPEKKKYIILGFGLCSNSLINLVSLHHELILPRVHDCIALFFGSQNLFRQATEKELGTLYLTKGFIESENGECHLMEYEKFKKKYGEVKAKEYMRKILVHYKRVVMLNTGSYPLNKYEIIARDFAEEFDLYYEEMKGTEKLFYKLISGEWDEEIICIPKGTPVSLDKFL